MAKDVDAAEKQAAENDEKQSMISRGLENAYGTPVDDSNGHTGDNFLSQTSSRRPHGRCR